MAKIFELLKSLFPSLPNLKPKIQRINYFLLLLTNIKMIHTIGSIPIYKNQDENLTTKIILRLYLFV